MWQIWKEDFKEVLKWVSSAILNNPWRVKHSVNGYVKKEINHSKRNTVFPHIVSAETILFWLWSYVLWPLISVHKCAETIQGGKLFKGGNYMRKYGFPHSELTCSHLESCSSGSIWALEGTELMRKCWISLKIILGTMYSATHINSAGGSAGPWLALGPWCWEQKPDSPKAEKF